MALDPRVFPPEVERVTAQQHRIEGRVICTLVGLNAVGQAIWTTTLYREADGG